MDDVRSSFDGFIVGAFCCEIWDDIEGELVGAWVQGFYRWCRKYLRLLSFRSDCCANAVASLKGQNKGSIQLISICM